MDRETCDYQLYAEKTVVEEVEDKVTLEDGRFGYCDKCLHTKAIRQLRSYHRHKEEINQRRKRNRELNKIPT